MVQARCGDWTSACLDVSPQTASWLTQLAHAADAEIDRAMGEGRWGLDRSAALVKLKGAGIGPELFTEAAEGYSLGRLYGDLPTLPGQHGGQGQRRADALTSICMDSLTGGSEPGEDGRAVTVAEVFVDATLASESFGEAGATISSGPRVGPNTLSEILCTGQIRIVATDGLQPVAYSDLGEAIPPAVRSFVLFRDQGQCLIEGCPSRYRLQPHHIRERRHGGDHHPDNLITLCWYHHHVAIHQLGFTIDPDGPTHRRRLHKPDNTGPPQVRLRDHVARQSLAAPN